MDSIVKKLFEAISNRVQDKTNTISDSYGLQFPKSLSEKDQGKISIHQFNYYKRFISDWSTIQVWKDRFAIFKLDFQLSSKQRIGQYESYRIQQRDKLWNSSLGMSNHGIQLQRHCFIHYHHDICLIYIRGQLVLSNSKMTGLKSWLHLVYVKFYELIWKFVMLQVFWDWWWRQI